MREMLNFECDKLFSNDLLGMYTGADQCLVKN